MYPLKPQKYLFPPALFQVLMQIWYYLIIQRKLKRPILLHLSLYNEFSANFMCETFIIYFYSWCFDNKDYKGKVLQHTFITYYNILQQYLKYTVLHSITCQRLKFKIIKNNFFIFPKSLFFLPISANII